MPFSWAREDEVFHDLHLLVEAAFFRKIPNTVEQAAAQRLPKDANRPGVRNGDADHHPDRTGFSGAVGAQQAEDFAFGNVKGEIVNGDKLVESLGNTIKLQRESHSVTS